MVKAENTTSFSLKTWINQAGTDIEASFLLAIFMVMEGAVYVISEEVIHGLTQL